MRPAKTYLRDTGENDVKGIVVIEQGDGEYLVTENRDGDWCNVFLMPVDEFESLDTEPVGKLSSGQYMTICRKSGAVA